MLWAYVESVPACNLGALLRISREWAGPQRQLQISSVVDIGEVPRMLLDHLVGAMGAAQSMLSIMNLAMDLIASPSMPENLCCDNASHGSE